MNKKEIRELVSRYLIAVGFYGEVQKIPVRDSEKGKLFVTIPTEDILDFLYPYFESKLKD